MIDVVRLLKDVAAHPMKFFLTSFLILLCVNASHLLDPPYWDSILGLFSQATWLEENDFDVLRLLREPGFREGGASVRPLNALALLLAMLYRVFAPTLVFAIFHLISLLSAALTLTLFYFMMRSFLPTRIATAWCVAGAVNPIFSGQCAAAYLEMPIAACMALVIYSLHKQKYLYAGIWVLVAFFVKETALILALAVFFWMLLRWVLSRTLLGDQHGSKPKKTMWLLLLLPLLVCLMLLMPGPWRFNTPTLQWILAYSWLLFPSQAILVILTIGCSVGLVGRKKTRRDVLSDPNWFYLVLLLMLLVWGFWLSFWLHEHALCRYSVSVMLPLMALVALLFSKLFGSRAALILACSVIGWGIINQWGTYLPRLPNDLARGGDLLERSREYLIDLDGNRQICHQLEESYQNSPIVTKYPFVQMLTMPEMGYVQKSLPRVYAAGRRPSYTTALQMDKATWENPESVFIYTPNSLARALPPPLVPVPGDEILFVDDRLSAPVIAYRRRGAKQETP